MRLWCHSEELHSRLTIIHNLENRLAALNEQYKAEVQNTQKVHIMHPRCKNVQNGIWIHALCLVYLDEKGFCCGAQ